MYLPGEKVQRQIPYAKVVKIARVPLDGQRKPLNDKSFRRVTQQLHRYPDAEDQQHCDQRQAGLYRKSFALHLPVLEVHGQKTDHMSVGASRRTLIKD
jgi:hypothetical protein